MKNTWTSIVIACGLAASSLSAQATGFTLASVAHNESQVLEVGIWYPTEQPPASQPNTDFGHALAVDAPPANTNGALVVISHGYSGWYAGHANTAAALADAGFIVAAPSHAGNTWSDMSSTPEQWVIDRPQHISSVIDYVLAEQRFDGRIDEDKIAVYGFSAGGYTAVGLIGGVPDLNAAALHCKNFPQEYVCAEGLIDSMIGSGMQQLPAAAWGADERVSVAAISAPGFAFAYTEESLQNVNAKVQLWSGQSDEQVPTATNAALLAERLPQTPETHWVENANHFAFLVMPCREAFRKSDPEEYQVICGDREGFDRRQFQNDMHVEMLRFFNEAFDLQ
jgi:predicted dienelactone hydrolase